LFERILPEAREPNMPIDSIEIARYLVNVLGGGSADPAMLADPSSPEPPPGELVAELGACIDAILEMGAADDDEAASDLRVVRTRAACLMAELDHSPQPEPEPVGPTPSEERSSDLLVRLAELLERADPRPARAWLRTLAATNERHAGERTTLHWALRILVSVCNQRVVDEATALGQYVSDHLPNTTSITTSSGAADGAWLKSLWVTSFNCLADRLAATHGRTTHGNLGGLARFPVGPERHAALCRTVERMLTGRVASEPAQTTQPCAGGVDVVCLQEVSRAAYDALVAHLDVVAGGRASISPWCPKRTATPIVALQMYLATMAAHGLADDAASARVDAHVARNLASIEALERMHAAPGAPFTTLEAGAMLYPPAEWGNVTIVTCESPFVHDGRMAETARHTDACLPDGSACCRTELVLPNGQQVVLFNTHMHMLAGHAPFMTQAELAERLADGSFAAYLTTDSRYTLPYARICRASERLVGLLRRTAELYPEAHVLLLGDTNVDLGGGRASRPSEPPARPPPQVFTFQDYQQVCAALPEGALAVAVHATGLMCGNAYASPWPCQLDQAFCHLRADAHVVTNRGVDPADITAAERGDIADRDLEALQAGFRILERREEMDHVRCISCGGGSWVPARPGRPARAVSDVRSMLEQLAEAGALF